MQFGYIEALQIQREKGCPFEKVQSIELYAGRGVVGDCHSLSGEKQIALISTKAREWMKAQAVKGLCFSKFQENILINSMDFPALKQGTVLNTDCAKLEIIAFSKRCFQECSLVKGALPCKLKADIRFAKVIQSGTVQLGARIWVDSND